MKDASSWESVNHSSEENLKWQEFELFLSSCLSVLIISHFKAANHINTGTCESFYRRLKFRFISIQTIACLRQVNVKKKCFQKQPYNVHMNYYLQIMCSWTHKLLKHQNYEAFMHGLI